MAKRSLSDWAAIAELVGTVIVVVSLVFVVFSIRQNTQELRLQNENYLFNEMNDSLDSIVHDPSFTDINLKVVNGQELSPIAQMRYTAFLYQRVNLWEMSYFWNRDGYLDSQKWEDWDDFFAVNIEIYMPHDLWVEMRPAYTLEFVEHVDEKYEAVRYALQDRSGRA